MHTPFRLDGKTALVTGGASGLCRATVEEVLSAGGNAVIVDLERSPGKAVAEELGSNVVFAPTDVTSPEDVEAAVALAVERFGALHIAVNCAGAGGGARIVGRDDVNLARAGGRRIVEVNLTGTFNVVRVAAAKMARNEPGPDGERGVIVNTASNAAFDGQIGQAAYSASKGGVVGLTLPVARDLASHGIRVCTIAPGPADTPMLERLREDIRRGLEEQVPFPKRLGAPEEYAALAIHIVENRYLNAEVIRLDGGLRMPPR